MNNVLGVDIGGTGIKSAIVSPSGEIKDKRYITIKELAERGDLRKTITDYICQRMAETEMTTVGIGIPGLLNRERNTPVEVTNIPAIEGINFSDIIHDQQPHATVFLENDAATAALAAAWFDPNRLSDSFVFITFGTGVGGALVIEKALFGGPLGNAMEISMMIESDAVILEDRLGRDGICALVNQHLEQQGDALRVAAPIEISHALKQGHPHIKEAMNKAALRVANALHNLITLLDVRHFMIGGGVAPLFLAMEPTIRQRLDSTLTPYYRDYRFALSDLGNDAGLLGAAGLCFSKEE